jgi:hypothetical protein
MASNEISLRRAYELGRLRASSRSLVWIGLFAAALIALGAELGATLQLGAVLALLVLGLRFRGLAYGRAALPGLGAGALAALMPALAMSGGHCCIGDACVAVCLVACVGGGLLAGALIGMRAAREDGDRLPFLLSAATVATLAASVGCVMAGASGVIGMIAAIGASSASVLYVELSRA